MPGAAIVYIFKRHGRGWTVDADPEEIFQEMYGPETFFETSKARAISRARKVRREMSAAMPGGYGHPDDSEILLMNLPPPGGNPPSVYSFPMQEAGSEALYTALKRSLRHTIYDLSTAEAGRLFRAALSHLGTMPLDEETHSGAEWWVHGQLTSTWERIEL